MPFRCLWLGHVPNSEAFTVAVAGLISWLRPIACGAGVVEIGRLDPTLWTKRGLPGPRGARPGRGGGGGGGSGSPGTAPSLAAMEPEHFPPSGQAPQLGTRPRGLGLRCLLSK